MLIKNTNLRRIVSLLFVLCLIFCLVPTAAFAEGVFGVEEDENNTEEFSSLMSGTIETNDEHLFSNYGDIGLNKGTVEYNRGTITTNDKAVFNHKNYFVESGGYVELNHRYIWDNYGLVYHNAGEEAIVYQNYGTVFSNDSYVETNHGTVVENHNTVASNEGTVEDNSYGTVEYNCGTVNGGTVTYNCGGTVNDGTVINKCYSVSFVDTGYLPLWTALERGNYVHNHYESVDGELDVSKFNGDARYTYWVVEGTAFQLELKSGYEPCITKGTGTVKSLGNNKYAISSSGGNIELELRPISTGSVPATADMSNVPLWSALLLVFAATAILTRKKKNG